MGANADSGIEVPLERNPHRLAVVARRFPWLAHEHVQEVSTAHQAQANCRKSSCRWRRILITRRQARLDFASDSAILAAVLQSKQSVAVKGNVGVDGVGIQRLTENKRRFLVWVALGIGKRDVRR